MIIIFDLDDTLYPEISYVKSGFLAVSNYLSLKYGFDESQTYSFFLKTLRKDGREGIFNKFLKIKKVYNKNNLNKCISIYRNHNPKITLYSDAKACIKRFQKYRKYIITDGNVIVQRNKVKALEITNQFIKIIPTYQYGISYSKPSISCFNKIMEYEGCLPSDMIYIGDNPNKDFVNIKKVGIRTARILRGSFKDVKLNKSHEAEFEFESLNGITKTFINGL